MKHLLKRLTRDIPGFFIGDILHNEDDPTKHSSAKLIFFILSMMFVAVLIISPTYILSHNWKEFIKVLIIAATVITGLFYLKYTGKIIITAHLIALTLFLTTVYNSFFCRCYHWNKSISFDHGYRFCAICDQWYLECNILCPLCPAVYYN